MRVVAMYYYDTKLSPLFGKERKRERNPYGKDVGLLLIFIQHQQLHLDSDVDKRIAHLRWLSINILILHSVGDKMKCSCEAEVQNRG